MSNLLKALNQRPIAYYPIHRAITGSTTAGILLSQLMYWFSKKEKIYKTDAEIISETMLTENELRGAKNKIKNLDFITVSREGIPAKTYYQIDWELYETSLVNFTKLEGLNSQDCDSEFHETITETTTETTTDIKKSKPKKFTPPTFQEIQAYVKEKNYNVDAQKFFDYYEAGEWSDAKGSKVKNWKQKVITWDKRDNGSNPQPKSKTSEWDEALEQMRKREQQGEIYEGEIV